MKANLEKMTNQQMLEELLERAYKIELTFPTKDNRGISIPLSMSTSKDIKELSQWVNECIIVLDELKVLNKDLLCKEFREVYSNIENVRLNKFQSLVGAIQAILNKYFIEKKEEDEGWGSDNC